MPEGLTSSSLPHYDKPPVCETVLGVQFDRLSAFTNSHLGAFWKTLDQKEWPRVEDAPPLPNQIERFTTAARWAAGVQFQLTDDPFCRSRIKNKNGDRMIQVQSTRLHLNWLGGQGSDYPRYDKMRAEFEHTFRLLSDFVSDENVGTIKSNQWEITYVNQIPKGTVWQNPSDWHFFKLLGSISSIEETVGAESFHGAWQFVIPGNRGRLHIEWQHGKKPTAEKDSREFVRLTFTARGPLEQRDDMLAAALDGLDLGRKAIVTTFRDFVTDEANNYWGLQHGG